jgi:hypothetical protein
MTVTQNTATRRHLCAIGELARDHAAARPIAH